MMKISTILLLWVGVLSCSVAQNLQRRPFLGVQVAAVSDSLASANKLKSTGGAHVVRVIPNSTAEALKLQPSDVILKVNGKSIATHMDVVAAARAFQVGENVALTVSRRGRTVTAKGKVQPMPYEAAANADVIYDEVQLENGGYSRAIIKKPKSGGKLPVVFYIQGYSCGSIDNLPEGDAQRRLMDGLLDKGYAVFKMEKPGDGDTKGTKPCQEIGYEEELAAFAAGLKKLKQYDFIDADNIFLFGHSLGGTTAPLIAANDKVKGIITYGAVGKPWLEYMIELFREQRPVSGTDYVQVDNDLRMLLPLTYELMVLKKSPMELSENDAYKQFLENNLEYDGNGHLFGRHYTYLQELQDVPVNKAWRDAAAYTLAIYGEADVQALDAEGAKIISEVVNSYHPGKGAYEVLPRTDHGFIEVGDKQDYIRLNSSGEYAAHAQQHFSQKLVDLLDAWMKDKLTKTS